MTSLHALPYFQLNPHIQLYPQHHPVSLQAVQWERIIVDEAHQEPGLMNSIMYQFAAMAKYCVTGTPYSDKV